MKRLLLLTTLALVAMAGSRPAYGQAAVEAWVQRYNGSAGASADTATVTAVDAASNVIVAGHSDAGITGNDWVIIKYSGAGVALWTNRYNGPGNDDDRASAVTVDGSGNVIVTGISTGNGSGLDYATIKYSQAGVALWTNRYGGPANNMDRATAVAVDPSGKVFVTGSSQPDYVTIGYSSAGVPLWTNRYLGGFATAVAVAGSGDVFVTGYSFGSGSGLDYATIKYSGAGLPLWTNRYDGPLNGDDWATAIAVDGSGNVFVTGSALVAVYAFDDYFVDDRAYATVAYSGTGGALWTNLYNGGGPDFYTYDAASAVAVDGNGAVFVTGASEGDNDYSDYATIAYSTTGVALWTNRFNGNGAGDDHANAVAVDGSGNVFVTGFSGSWLDYATIKYSGTGVSLWTNRYDGAGNGGDIAYALAVDGGGNVFVTGSSPGPGSSLDYATIKYSGAGMGLWTNRYDGSANRDDRGNSLVVDGGGNVIVTGASIGSDGFPDYTTIKYSPSGVPLWTNSYSGPGNYADQPSAVAVDSSGNVFVTGYSASNKLYPYSSQPYNYDYVTIKYSGAGLPLWTNRYAGPGVNGFDQATTLAVDGSGNVFVVGASESSGNYSVDYATIKYSAAGVPLWTNRYNGPGNYDDRPSAAAVDGSGNIFVTGYSEGLGSSADYATIKYSAAGALVWANRYNGPNSGDYARALAVDAGGNVFVTGTSYGAGGSSSDWETVKYSSGGTTLWTHRYNGPGNGFDEAYAVAADSSGNIFVTGYSVGSSGSVDYATIKYSGAGVPLWTNRYSGPLNTPAFPTAVAVDLNGNAFVTGSSDTLGTVADFVTIGYSSAGVPLWTNRYNGPANGYDSPPGYDLMQSKQSLAIGPDGSVYVTGSSDGDYTGADIRDFVTVKYSSHTGAPLLTIVRSNAFVVISRPVTALGFQLQESTNFALPNYWSAVTYPAATNGAKVSVTVPTTAGGKIFRLKSQ